MSFTARRITYTSLTPEDTKERHPLNNGHYEVSISFDCYEGSEWISLQASNGDNIDLSPEEQRDLVRLLVGRFPLDALAGI